MTNQNPDVPRMNQLSKSEEYNPYSSFWVIFDTCTLPEYYLDVHNLLALPEGAIIPYDYREKYLSDESVRILLNARERKIKILPQKVLLIYAQSKSYHKGNPSPKNTIPSDMFYITTRIAEIVNEPDKIGENYHFDLLLRGYPDANKDEALKKILLPLIEKGEVPFIKWIALSHEYDSYLEIISPNKTIAWQKIVEQFWKTDNQFSSDAFWRVEGMYQSNSNEQIPPKNRIYSITSEHDNKISKVKYLYTIQEGRSYLLFFMSYEPKIDQQLPKADNANQSSRPSRKPHNLSIQTSSNSPISIDGGEKLIPLRQYIREIIIINAQQYDGLKALSGDLNFATCYSEENEESENNEWPIGAEFNISFSVRKAPLQILFSIILGIIGVSVFPLASNIWTVSPLAAYIILPIAALCLAGSGLIYTGRASLK